MMHHDRVRALLGLEVELLRQAHADVLLWLEEAEDLGLVLEVGARRMPERVARPAVLLMEQVGDARQVLPGDAEEFADLLVSELGEGFHRPRETSYSKNKRPVSCAESM